MLTEMVFISFMQSIDFVINSFFIKLLVLSRIDISSQWQLTSLAKATFKSNQNMHIHIQGGPKSRLFLKVCKSCTWRQKGIPYIKMFSSLSGVFSHHHIHCAQKNQTPCNTALCFHVTVFIKPENLPSSSVDLSLVDFSVWVTTQQELISSKDPRY